MNRLAPLAVLLVIVWGGSNAAQGDGSMERKIRGCVGGPGEIKLVSPRSGEVFASKRVRVAFDVDCPNGGVNVILGIDGSGYQPRGGTLVPAPDDPGCDPEPDESECWPSLGDVEGRIRYRVSLDAGPHTILLRTGIQGTNPPTFERMRVGFVVGRLAATGSTITSLLVLSIGLILLGGSIAAGGRARVGAPAS